MDTQYWLVKESLLRGLEWIDRNQNSFGIESFGAEADAKIKAVKPVGELALAASLLRFWEIEKAWAKKQLDFCWASFDKGEVLLHLLLARPDLIVISTVYASFKCNGYINDKLEHLIAFLSSSDCCSSIEFPRWRQLDLEHGLSALGLRSFPENAHIGTWINGLPEPWLLTDDIAYAVTHEIFYITDFGSKPDRLPQYFHEYVSRWLSLWIKLYIARDNYDLVAELVMVGLCLGLKEEMYGGISILTRKQHKSGYFPGPGNMRSSPSLGTIFLHNYHTTIVGVLALSMFLRFAQKEYGVGD